MRSYQKTFLMVIVNLKNSFVHTCPCVMSRLHEKCNKIDTPAKLYNSEITSVSSGEYIPILQPRNLRPVQNVRCKQQQKKRVSHDGLYNLHEIAIDISEYIHEIHTFPDLVCVLGQKMKWIEFFC